LKVDNEEDFQSLKDKLIDLLRKEDIIHPYDACHTIDCYPRQLEEVVDELRKEGYEIIFQHDKLFISRKIAADVSRLDTLSDEKEIVFGVTSDLHFGSKAVQITALNKFCEECRKQDVKYIFAPGDITAGYRVYPGQEIDVYAFTSEDQEKSAIANLPKGQ
jgi:pantothenate synthetase